MRCVFECERGMGQSENEECVYDIVGGRDGSRLTLSVCMYERERESARER